MLFVTLCTARPGASEAAMKRRLGWRVPKGSRIVAEFWLPTMDPRVVIAMETDDPATIFEGQSEWDDIYEMKTFPAVTGEYGLQMARAMLAEHGAATPKRAKATPATRTPVGV